jgi:predicted Zn-dependent protease with MMP-like domain
MDADRFDALVQEEYNALPERYRGQLDNVHIIVEDLPAAGSVRRRGTRSGTLLLGLYEGIPLTRRGSEYGATPVLPDRITLFRRNIEAIAASEEDVRTVVRETLIHEIGHYYGMSEAEIRRAGY